MRLAILDNNFPSTKDFSRFFEIKEFIRVLGYKNIKIYTENINHPAVCQYKDYICDISEFEESQNNYDCVYSYDPRLLMERRIKIPYFYDIPSLCFDNELDYRTFEQIYSKLAGASAVFVYDKLLNKYAHWLGLNSYWVPRSVDTDIFKFEKKKFMTPQLNMLIYDNINSDPRQHDLIKTMLKSFKNPWDLNLVHYTAPVSAIKKAFSEAHICLQLSYIHSGKLDAFPSTFLISAMASGCVGLANNDHGNNTHILFDRVHYFRIDDSPEYYEYTANGIIKIIKYIDQRREKLERVSEDGSKAISKYFNLNIVNHKLSVLNNLG